MRFQRGVAGGEFRAEDVAIDALYGPIYYRLLAYGAPIDEASLDRTSTWFFTVCWPERGLNPMQIQCPSRVNGRPRDLRRPFGRRCKSQGQRGCLATTVRAKTSGRAP
jgi:hypothetical protein